MYADTVPTAIEKAPAIRVHSPEKPSKSENLAGPANFNRAGHIRKTCTVTGYVLGLNEELTDECKRQANGQSVKSRASPTFPPRSIPRGIGAFAVHGGTLSGILRNGTP